MDYGWCSANPGFVPSFRVDVAVSSLKSGKREANA